MHLPRKKMALQGDESIAAATKKKSNTPALPDVAPAAKKSDAPASPNVAPATKKSDVSDEWAILLWATLSPELL